MCKIRDPSHSGGFALRLLTLIYVSNLAAAASDGASRSREMAPTGRGQVMNRPLPHVSGPGAADPMVAGWWRHHPCPNSSPKSGGWR